MPKIIEHIPFSARTLDYRWLDLKDRSLLIDVGRNLIYAEIVKRRNGWHWWHHDILIDKKEGVQYNMYSQKTLRTRALAKRDLIEKVKYYMSMDRSKFKN